MITADQIPDCVVLVVDDEPDNLEVVRLVLKYYKATVHSANNGKEALETLKQIRPDFIITDLSMPIMDGWEFAFHVKENPHTKDIPIFALTAHAMVGDRERTIAAGFHNYLTKPLSPITFLQQLLSVLGDVDLNRPSEQETPLPANLALPPLRDTIMRESMPHSNGSNGASHSNGQGKQAVDNGEKRDK